MWAAARHHLVARAGRNELWCAPLGWLGGAECGATYWGSGGSRVPLVLKRIAGRCRERGTGSVPDADVGTMGPTRRGGQVEREEIERELSADGAQELLASSSSAHLAYVAPDGTPRVIPVGVFWTGEEFVVSTAITAPKVRALSASPDVALTIDAGDTPGGARALSVRGRARVEIVEGVVPEYLAAARRTMDAEAAAVFEQNVRRMYPRMARIAITPTWLRFYDFGSGRIPRFLQELAQQSQLTAADWAD